MATGYNFIAQKFLFHPRAAPRWCTIRLRLRLPRLPLPELPRYHGQMNLGDGAMVLMVEHSGGSGKSAATGPTPSANSSSLDVIPMRRFFQWTYNGKSCGGRCGS